MNLSQWLNATNPRGRGITLKESERRQGVRARVLAAAGTTIGTLRVAKCRFEKGEDGIGSKLGRRLEEATANEREKFLLSDQFRRSTAHSDGKD